MTYRQLRRHLSAIAQHGDAGAPHALYPPARWRHLVLDGLVTPSGDRWRLTARGAAVLAEPTMPRQRPAGRASHHARRRMRRVA